MFYAFVFHPIELLPYRSHVTKPLLCFAACGGRINALRLQIPHQHLDMNRQFVVDLLFARSCRGERSDRRRIQLSVAQDIRAPPTPVARPSTRATAWVNCPQLACSNFSRLRPLGVRR